MANGVISLAFADGRHDFNIAPIKVAIELEEKCNAGIATIFERVRRGGWYVSDIRETIRLGLIGAGLDPLKALALVVRYVDDRPWQESRPIAMQVIMAAMVGVKGDPLGKPLAERQDQAAASIPVTAVSSAPPSTALAPSSDLVPASLTR